MENALAKDWDIGALGMVGGYLSVGKNCIDVVIAHGLWLSCALANKGRIKVEFGGTRAYLT
jgi:hypothetical protein